MVGKKYIYFAVILLLIPSMYHHAPLPLPLCGLPGQMGKPGKDRMSGLWELELKLCK